MDEKLKAKIEYLTGRQLPKSVIEQEDREEAGIASPKRCSDCGTTEVPSHHRAIRCVSCQIKDQRTRAIERNRGYRRKTEESPKKSVRTKVQKPKSNEQVPKLCKDCGTTELKDHHKVIRCDPCQLRAYQERQRNYDEKKRLAKPPKPLTPLLSDGNKFCKDCGTADIRAHHNIVRCDPCQRKHRSTQAVLTQQRYRALNRDKYLEADRENQRKFRAKYPERKQERAKQSYERRKAKIADMESRMTALENELRTIKWFLTLLFTDTQEK